MSEFAIPVFTALVSVIVSVVITTMKNKADLARVLKEQEHGYAKALFEKRVERYPELYAYLSEYSKRIRAGTQHQANFAEFKEQLDHWNNKHSLFFTRTTSTYSAKFRYLMNAIIKGGLTSALSRQDWERIRNLIGYFEDFLKAEIGIYAAMPAGNVDEFASAYTLIDNLIDDIERRTVSPREEN
ncbi:MAG: hypothetical protein WAM70_08560 [Pyrinomonadaceae bacterium]